MSTPSDKTILSCCKKRIELYCLCHCRSEETLKSMAKFFVADLNSDENASMVFNRSIFFLILMGRPLITAANMIHFSTTHPPGPQQSKFRLLLYPFWMMGI